MNPQIKHQYTWKVLYEGDAGMTTRQMLEKATASRANLGGANLGGANLYAADLYGANLRGANLYAADLYGANLRGANLYGADLRGANLGGANLYGANLRGANLRGADLRGANLGGANLYGANLRGANLYGADLRGANLGDFGKLIGPRPYLSIGPIGSRSDYLQAFLTNKGVHIRVGCFAGTLDDFRAAVEKTHGDTDYGKEYEMAMLMIEAHAAIWMPKDVGVVVARAEGGGS